MNPLWLSGGAAVVNSAAGLLGMFGSRGPSERDLMWEQSKIGRSDYEYTSQRNMHYAKLMPKAQMAGLRNAGVNPMLAYGNFGGDAGGKMSSPSVPSPVNRMEPLMRGLEAGVNSALAVAKTMAEIDKTKAETTLTTAKEATEIERPAEVRASVQQKLAETLNTRQRARLAVLDTELRRHDITVRKREALMAGIAAGVLEESVESLRAFVQGLGFDPDVSRTVLRGMEQLRKLKDEASEGVSSAIEWLKTFNPF